MAIGLQSGVLFWITLTGFLLNSLPDVRGAADLNAKYPATTMNYKFLVPAGKEDCVFQYTEPGAVLYVDFTVIRGGDSYCSFAVKDPLGKIVLPYEWKTHASYETNNTIAGYYSVCIYNQYAKFGTKLIMLYIATYNAGFWEQYIEDLNKPNEEEVSAREFTRIFANIGLRISEALHFLHQSKAQEARDYAVLSDNNYNISFWSCVQCVIMIGSGIMHVVIIRKLFKESASPGKFNART